MGIEKIYFLMGVASGSLLTIAIFGFVFWKKFNNMRVGP